MLDESVSALAEAAVDRGRLREKALTLAVSHYRKINFTGDPDRIVGLAERFYVFLIKENDDV